MCKIVFFPFSSKTILTLPQTFLFRKGHFGLGFFGALLFGRLAWRMLLAGHAFLTLVPLALFIASVALPDWAYVNNLLVRNLISSPALVAIAFVWFCCGLAFACVVRCVARC